MIVRSLLAATAASALFALAPAALAQRSAPVAAAVVPPINYVERTLPNGLRVFSAVDRSTSNLAIQVIYGVGSKDDPPGRSGFAHLFEHIMFKATRDMPAEFMDRLTEDVGGANNASTEDDFTEYHEVIPANHLERLLWAEAERMSSLVVDDASFKSERDVVKEELRQRVLASPYGRLFSLDVPEASFTTHPYKRPGIGSIEDLDAASLADVKAFHATYYRPDDAALIVIGNFDQAQLDQWVDKYFGPIRRPDLPIPRVTAVEPARQGAGHVDAYGPNVPLPALAITWLAPAADSKDQPALDVLDAVLSTGDASRLKQHLVHDQQLASDVFSSADLRQQPGLFWVGAILAGKKTLAQGEAGLLAEVRALRDQPVGAAELDRAKTQLTTDALRGRESVEDRASALGSAIWIDQDPARVNDAVARLQAVTAADVQRVARTYLPDDRRMVVRYQSESLRPGGPAKDTTGASPPVAAPQLPAAAQGAPQQLAPEPRQSPPPPGAPVKARLPVPVERTLANGLRVIVAKSTDLPLVTAELTVRTGGAADPAGKAGLADLTATLLEKGSGGRSATEMARAVEDLGATLDTGASWDGSQLSMDVMADRLDRALPLIADMARRPDFSPAELELARSQSLDDLTVELQEPGTLARYASAVAVFAGAPYGHVLGGDPGSLKRITRQDILALHSAYYRPDNAILVLTGDIDPERGFALAERAFGDWRAPAAALPARPTGAPSAAPRVIVIDLPGTGQAAVDVAMPGLARSDPRFYPGLVANDVLGGGYSSRLNEEIRIKRGLSYGAGSSLDARRDVGPFLARVQTKNESAPEVVDLVLSEIRGLGAGKPSAEEVAARQASINGAFGRTVETTSGLAATLSSYAIQDIPLSELAVHDERVQAVTADAAASFVAGALDPAKATVVVAGDAKLFLPQLKAKFPNLEVIPADQLDFDQPSLRRGG